MVNVYYLRAVNGYAKEGLANTSASIYNQATDPHQIGTSKSIGTEVDAIVNYHIDRNLTYYVEGGYLFAGNFWKGVTPLDASRPRQEPG